MRLLLSIGMLMLGASPARGEVSAGDFGESIRPMLVKYCGACHDPEDLPLVLGGRGCGTVRPGRRLTAKTDTPLCNLYLSMMQRMGIEADSFGDSTGELDGLS